VANPAGADDGGSPIDARTVANPAGADDGGSHRASRAGEADACACRRTDEPIRSRRYTPPAPRRPTVVVVAGLDKLLGRDPGGPAEQIGVGPIADSVLAAHLAETDIGVDFIGAVFGAAGEPLWLGRRVRYATDAQFLALIVRDKGCTVCGAGYDRCQAHHLTPWNAPAAGETDLDKLAMVCDDCHHRLHDANETLYRDRITGEWRTRPATATETPPAPIGRRPQPRRPSRPH